MGDTDDDNINSQRMQEPTGDQRVERAMNNSDQNDTDEIIRKMISNIRKEPINFPPNLTDIKKPRSYNKKKDSKRAKVSNPIYHRPLAIEHIVDSTEINIDPPVKNQPSIQQPIQTNDSPTDSINQDTNDQQVYNEPVPIQPDLLQPREESAEAPPTTSTNDTSHTVQGQLRRSSRVAELSAKALQLATANGNKP